VGEGRSTISPVCRCGGIGRVLSVRPPDTRTPESDAADTFGSDELTKWNEDLAAAAGRGTMSLVDAWEQIPKLAKPILKGSLDRIHKPH
jgi:hypothetical protein